MVKNLPAKAGDIGLIPGLGRFHMLWGNEDPTQPKLNKCIKFKNNSIINFKLLPLSTLSLFTFMHWRRKWQPTSVFLPEESQGWVASLHGILQARILE